jgi:serine phosphatase RsbU (regulator of sigma subunit)/anti-sigma regulatory factor (Ser/Thr protein kinase)
MDSQVVHGILDALDEAIIFSDAGGVIQQINRRAAELFEIDAKDFLNGPRVALARTVALQTEDPDGFMETLQQLRANPSKELRFEIEQVLPVRRNLRMYSGPAPAPNGGLGRIDVFADISVSVRRANEIELLYEQARAAAESYRGGLLPEGIPSLPRFNMVAHYIPAADGRSVCGDFYDFVPLSEGRMGLVIGDVCGTGPRAANDSALARHSLRYLATEERDPGRLLERASEQIRAQIGSERFVRLAFVLLDPERAMLGYSTAGQAPPILYRAETKEVEWLEDGGLPLAVEANPHYETARRKLDPGDMLILYTDGVTEAARRGRPFGQRKLGDLVKQYGVGTPGEFIQALRRAVGAWVGGGELRDDIALLVSQVVPDTAVDEPTRELVLPNEPARIREVRRFVGSFLADVRAPVDTSADILLAASEAAANACRYGRRSETWSELRIQCRLERQDVVVSITDVGSGIDPARFEVAQMPVPFASGGRGLFLMQKLMDEVTTESSEEGTTVTLRRRVFDQAGSSGQAWIASLQPG